MKVLTPIGHILRLMADYLCSLVSQLLKMPYLVNLHFLLVNENPNCAKHLMNYQKCKRDTLLTSSSI